MNRIIEWSGENGNLSTYIALYRGGIIVSGPSGNIKVS